MNIPVFSQRDPRWANQSINGTRSTLGGYGCTTTVIACISGRDPGAQESYMRSIGAYTSDLVLWTKIPGFKSRFYCTTSAAPLDAIKAEIRAGRPVLLNVHLGGGAIKANHWVLAVDENITVIDPWYGDSNPITLRYGSPAVAILGGAYFTPQVDLGNNPAPAPSPTTVLVTVSSGQLNIRSVPTSKTNNPVGRLSKGNTIRVFQGVSMGNDGLEWLRTQDGRYIWKGGVTF